MVFVRKAYEDSHVFGSERIKDKSIVEPGQVLPMNKLIKGVINGSIVINPRFMEYDFKEGVSDDFEEGRTPSETLHNQNEAFIAALDKQSDIPSDPTASPVFDAVDAENLANALASQVAIEGDGDVGEGAATPKSQAATEPVMSHVGSPTSDGEDNN